MILKTIKENSVICWWSGGVTSAVACKLAADIYGLDNCRFIMIDTKNEHEDTYRFKKDCEKWYRKEIEVITAVDGKRYDSIEDVWWESLSLSVAHGAVCSYRLKRLVRVEFQRKNNYSHQVFGFEANNKELKRAVNLKKNYPAAMPIYPLLMFGYDKEDCIRIIENKGIEIPISYQLGFHNNNCFQTGCVKGGIAYWKKMKSDFPDKFEKMAQLEHDLTDEKGEPVTISKDQSKSAKESGIKLVFLKKHPEYPDYKCIDDIKTKGMKPLSFECNGFCGTKG